MDINKIATRIADTTGKSMPAAHRMASQLVNAPSELQSLIVAWCDGNELPFEYNGITLELIMSKEGGSYIGALFSMWSLMEHPEFVSNYRDMDVPYDVLGG